MTAMPLFSDPVAHRPHHAGHYPVRSVRSRGMDEPMDVELDYYRCPGCRQRSELDDLDSLGADKDCAFCPRCGLEFLL